ncbi:MAG: zinc ribbon domain-containing protein [Bacilli bacterium]|nr:zinc ribbon domain-containing protein [Bacilli bacterium]
MSLIKCEECGKEISETAKTCPKCGFKVKKEISKNEKKDRIKLFVTIGIILACFIAVGIVCINLMHQNKVKKYKEKYEEIVDKIYSSGIEAEDCISLYRKVWYNTIWEEEDTETDKYTKDSNGEFYDDFNDSLHVLSSDSNFSKRISSLEIDSDIVQSLFDDLKNPPKEMKDAYDDLDELVDVYLSFINLATNPSGSLKSYTEKYTELDDKVVSLYKKVQRNID